MDTCVPTAFGSTYDREINFTDNDWLARIENPLAKTWVAVRPRDHDRRVLSATSLVGPLANPDPASNPHQASSEMRDGSDHHQIHGEASPMSFQIAGLYTAPEARGQGIAKAAVKTAMEYAIGYAKEKGRPLALSVVVYATNHAAISFYESCGFVADAGGPRASFNALKNSIDDELCMHYYTNTMTPPE